VTDRAYARISLDNERSGSISKQLASLQAHGSTDIEFYKDESVSGSKISFADRPAGAALLRDLRKGDRVLFTKIDRAARSVRDLLDLMQHVEDSGASVVFVEQNIDTAGPMGRFVLTLLGAIAELEAGIIGERRRESLAAFTAEGRHAVGAAPFGFRSVEREDGRGKVIRPDLKPDESLGGQSPAEMLRGAVRRVLAGEAQARIASTMPLSEAGLSVLLRNPRLAGMTPTEGGVYTVGGVPRVDPEAALLSMTEWNKLRTHMERPEKKPWAHQDGFGSVLICATCGDRLYKSVGGAGRPNNNAYKCGRRKHAPGEPAASVMVHLADAYVEQVFLAAHGDLQVVMTVWSDDADKKTEAVSTAQVQLDEVRRRQDRATSEAEEEELVGEYLRAKSALREAQAMPSERVARAEYTGETVAERWARSDDAGRCRLLAAAGRWVVTPGRLPVGDKIRLERDDLLLELLLHPVGEGHGAPVGFVLADRS
jgi:DNA invertase Pin-like site-specific DNA recombinase